jgi:hypothetical protein
MVKASVKEDAMAKKNRKYRKLAPVVDVKKARANDKEAPRVPAKNASAVKKGAMFAVLAGRPSKQAVTAVFGQSGYALSWVARAERLGMPARKLCEKFASNPAAVKQSWAALAVK